MANETDNPLADAITLDDAARIIGWRYDRVREFVINHGLGIRWGGSDEHPRLRVRISELRQAIANQRVMKNDAGRLVVRPKRGAPRQQYPGLHRHVRC